MLQPTKDFMLVEILDSWLKSEDLEIQRGGIIMPNKQPMNYEKAVVHAVWPDCSIEEGTVIYFIKNLTNIIKWVEEEATQSKKVRTFNVVKEESVTAYETKKNILIVNDNK